MQYLVMQTDDIATNLATEQYLMNSDKIKPPFMLFYIEKPCIIVGRNQNTLEEINQKYCEEHDITVTRRLSGGGAMYQDLGNLCFSFVVSAKEQKFGDFKSLVAPVVETLRQMGVPAEVNGRNDIVVDGKKFSGNAMYTRKKKTFCHGTLMFDVNTEAVASALKVPKDKIESKGIKSVRSRVINIKPYLKEEYQKLDTYGFRDELIKKIWQVTDVNDAKKYAYELDQDDKKEIEKLVQKTYRNWDWVYGNSPKFTVKKRKHFTNGTIDARFLVDQGMINSVKIYGDFFGKKDVSDIEKKLTSIRYEPQSIRDALSTFDLDQYFVGISSDKVSDLLALQQ